MTVEAHRHGQRRGTAAEWTAANPILADGELGIETDTSLMKIGDGVTLWSALAYANRGPQGIQGETGPAGPVASWDTLTDKPAVIAAGATVADARAVIATAPDVQDFTASGTWTKPAGAMLVCVELINGGDGGKTSSTTGANGGNGGAYWRTWLRADALASTIAVTVGAGGTPGNTGGASAFGALTLPSGGFPSTGPYLGGAGGVGTSSGGTPGGTGGNSYYGAGGGQGGGFVAGGAVGLGHASGDPTALAAGNGGVGASSGVAAANGLAPGGGGGGDYKSAGAGTGARGQVRVTTYF
jgi:hypothetical protein